MRIAIVHNAVQAGESPDASDVLIQVEAVAAALIELGHDAVRVPCTLDLAAVKTLLENLRPDLVFNLVESLDGTGRLIHVVPGLLDAMGLPYTGSCAEAILATSHKVLAKDRLAACRLPTPPWIGPFPEDIPALGSVLPEDGDRDGGRWLVKSLWEHASIGIDETDAVLCDCSDQIMDVLREHAPRFGGACFAERFIEGREFNLSLLAGADRAEVLKPAEIVFEGYPEDALRIVGYRAKWDPGSYEYHHTPRRFDFPASDAPLLERLRELAHQCWRAFGLQGYARVDFRVDAAGRSWILEINANPCLSADAGFAAALQQSGVGFTTAIARILADALKPCRPVPLAPRIRHQVDPQDPHRVRRLAESTGFFNPVEIAVAEELVTERLARGPDSGYFFVFVDTGRRTAGYACYGPVPLTASSFDLYWIVVAPGLQGQGIGRLLIQETERLIRQAAGSKIYIETSGRDQYEGTRAFYRRVGYQVESRLKDFYAPGDDKLVFSKSL